MAGTSTVGGVCSGLGSVTLSTATCCFAVVRAICGGALIIMVGDLADASVGAAVGCTSAMGGRGEDVYNGAVVVLSLCAASGVPAERATIMTLFSAKSDFF